MPSQSQIRAATEGIHVTLTEYKVIKMLLQDKVSKLKLTSVIAVRQIALLFLYLVE